MNDAASGADAASLSRLHDIIAPSPVSWWPLAPGWYVLGAALLLLLIWSSWHLITWWRKNAYRREAMVLLRTLPIDVSALPLMDEILKRTALSAWPREQVASLSGLNWMMFLDRTGNCKDFTEGAGQIFREAAYVSDVHQQDIGKVIAAAKHWVRHHKGPHSC